MAVAAATTAAAAAEAAATTLMASTVAAASVAAAAEGSDNGCSGDGISSSSSRGISYGRGGHRSFPWHQYRRRGTNNGSGDIRSCGSGKIRSSNTVERATMDATVAAAPVSAAADAI